MTRRGRGPKTPTPPHTPTPPLEGGLTRTPAGHAGDVRHRAGLGVDVDGATHPEAVGAVGAVTRGGYREERLSLSLVARDGVRVVRVGPVDRHDSPS